jgi:hypothetical protein
MLLANILLLPLAVASSVTLYVSSVPVTGNTAVIPSPIPLAQIEYDVDQSVGTLSSYTPPTGSYSSDHLLRVGLSDPKSGSWRGIVTSAASFADQYHKKFIIHVDEKGEPYHVGFGTSAKGSGEEVEVEIVRRNAGPKPVLNKPIVLNAEGKIDSKEPEKSFLQKYVALVVNTRAKLTVAQVLVGYCTVHSGSTSFRRWRFEIDMTIVSERVLYLQLSITARAIPCSDMYFEGNDSTWIDHSLIPYCIRSYSLTIRAYKEYISNQQQPASRYHGTQQKQRPTHWIGTGHYKVFIEVNLDQ